MTHDDIKQHSDAEIERQIQQIGKRISGLRGALRAAESQERVLLAERAERASPIKPGDVVTYPHGRETRHAVVRSVAPRWSFGGFDYIVRPILKSGELGQPVERCDGNVTATGERMPLPEKG